MKMKILKILKKKVINNENPNVSTFILLIILLLILLKAFIISFEIELFIFLELIFFIFISSLLFGFSSLITFSLEFLKFSSSLPLLILIIFSIFFNFVESWLLSLFISTFWLEGSNSSFSIISLFIYIL